MGMYKRTCLYIPIIRIMAGWICLTCIFVHTYKGFSYKQVCQPLITALRLFRRCTTFTVRHIRWCAAGAALTVSRHFSWHTFRLPAA